MNDIEWSLRQLAVSIEYLMSVIANDPFSYDMVPDSLHHAMLTLMREIENTNWEAV